MNKATNKEITVTIDRTISSCFEMLSELTRMKTIDHHANYYLRDELDEIVDISKSIIGGLRQLNDLIGVE